MLTTKKQVTFTGESTIDGVLVERYTATINTENPDNMAMATVQVRKDLRKENRETCRADQQAFEDAAYALQEELTASE